MQQDRHPALPVVTASRCAVITHSIGGDQLLLESVLSPPLVPLVLLLPWPCWFFLGCCDPSHPGLPASVRLAALSLTARASSPLGERTEPAALPGRLGGNPSSPEPQILRDLPWFAPAACLVIVSLLCIQVPQPQSPVTTRWLCPDSCLHRGSFPIVPFHPALTPLSPVYL